jgi:MFS family permease
MTEAEAMMGEVAALPGVMEAPVIPARRTNPLANFNLRLLWLGEGISLLGDQFYLVALPWLVLQLTGSAIAVGTVFAVAGIPRALLMLVGGVLTDRFSPRMLMLASNAARIVITGLLALLVLTNTIQLWMLYAFSLAFGVADAFFHPAYMAMIPALVEPEGLQGANVVLQGTSRLISAAGPGIGGVLVKMLGIAFSVILDALSFVAATLALLFMKPARVAKPAVKTERPGMFAAIREAISYIMQDETLRTLMLIVMVIDFLFTCALSVGPVMLAKERFTEGAVAQGILLSGMGVGSLIGMLASAVIKPSRLGVATLLMVGLAGLCMVGAGYASSLWLTAALFAFAGLCSGFSNLLLFTWLQRRISQEMMGRVMSILMLSSVGLMPISSALGGVIAEYNLTLLFVLNGTLLVLTVAFSLLNKSVRTMRA